jgi:hypothetical protein
MLLIYRMCFDEEEDVGISNCFRIRKLTLIEGSSRRGSTQQAKPPKLFCLRVSRQNTSLSLIEYQVIKSHSCSTLMHAQGTNTSQLVQKAPVQLPTVLQIWGIAALLNDSGSGYQRGFTVNCLRSEFGDRYGNELYHNCGIVRHGRLRSLTNS